MASRTPFLKYQVLSVYKKLHRSCQVVFANDIRALDAARIKINSEFKKNKNVTDNTSVEELIKFAREVESELITTVVQAEKVKDGKFSLKLRPGVKMHDNTPYRECPNR